MKKIIALVLMVILVMSVAFLPNNAEANHAPKPKKTIQGESYSTNNKNPDILYDWYVSAGGPEIMTDTNYWGFCKVWVQTTASKAYSNGFVRNNPDKSFYPGDGFGYSFSYGWAGDSSKCRNLTVCPIKSNHISPGSSQNCDLSKLKVLSKKVSKNGKAWSSAGTAEISTDENAYGHYIQLQINAERWGCHFPKKAPRVCGWAQISTTGSFSPNVPKIKLDTNLSQEYLNDDDSYKSGNLDNTYYLWDAVNIVHNPVYPWKKDRVGSLSVKVTKIYDLKFEKEFQCEQKECSYTLIHEGFEPWPRVYEYGSGSTIYNATKEGDIRKHLLVYKIDLFNLGKLIHKSENQSRPLVVVYDPVYDNYPYLVLKDDHAFSWGNRHAVGLQYKGSIGGGPDDAAGLHEKRRSKINSFNYTGFVFNQIFKTPLNETLSWSEASPIYNEEQRCSEYDFDASSFEAKNHGTAMFVKSGYGKIAFSYPILHTMLGKKYLYVNATAETVLQSVSFAGLVLKDLTDYAFQYPDTKFQNTIKVLTYDSNGARTEMPIEVKLSYDQKIGAQTLHEYVCQKTDHDEKTQFGDIAVGDMYDKINEGNGTGFVNLKYKKVSKWIPSLYQIAGLDPLDMDLNSAIEESLSPYNIELTVGGKSIVVDKFVSSQSIFTHVANFDQDNELNVTADFGILKIHPNPKFGQISKVTVNGNELQLDCKNGCSTVATNEDVTIEARNVWGGHASAHLEELVMPNYDPQFNWELAAIALTVAIVGGFLYLVGKGVLKRLGLQKQDQI